jgi:hypothetical protein
MSDHSIPDLEERALEMHKREIWRMEDEVAHGAGEVALQAGRGVARVLYLFSELIRPLFSWVPSRPSRS